MAPRRARFHRIASGRHWNGFVGRAVYTAHCKAGQASLRLSADSQLQLTRAQCSDGSREGARSQSALSQAPPRRIRYAIRNRRVPAAREVRADATEEERLRAYEAKWAEGG